MRLLVSVALILLGLCNYLYADDSCASFSSCVDCLSEQNNCRFCSFKESSTLGKCYDFKNDKSAEMICNSTQNTRLMRFNDECPVKAPIETNFLSNWMGEVIDIIGSQPLLSLALPGTHDSLTDDLSLIVSDGGADDYLKLAEILHKVSEMGHNQIGPYELEDWIRCQSQTQDLSVTSQLNNGIRFIDFRIMYEYSDKNPDWYSLHFMETVENAITYFIAIKNWLELHPSEVVVLWLSKHGNTDATGEDQYPKTPVEVKQAFWNSIINVFKNLLTDFTQTQINTTPLQEMIARNHRIVIYASDYAEFTNNSKYALNANLIQNHVGPGVSNETAAILWERELFGQVKDIKNEIGINQGFLLMSMATSVPYEQMFYSAMIRFLPERSSQEDILKCAAAFNIPGMMWCPQTLLDISNLENYYKQITLDEVYNGIGDYPNAIYINAVDYKGLIRTGTEVLWGGNGNGRSTNEEHKETGYAYVDSIIGYNINQICNKISTSHESNCAKMQYVIENRRQQFPIKLWNDSTYGRLVDWIV